MDRPKEYDTPTECPKCKRRTVYQDNFGEGYCIEPGCGWLEPKRAEERAVCESKPIPRATHETTLTIAGVELTVAVLDDGTRIIEYDSFVRLFEAFAEGHSPSEEEARELRRFVTEGREK